MVYCWATIKEDADKLQFTCEEVLPALSREDFKIDRVADNGVIGSKKERSLVMLTLA